MLAQLAAMQQRQLVTAAERENVRLVSGVPQAVEALECT